MPTDFDAWAEIYDSVYSYVHDDIPFYVKFAREAEGPALELGCGTGRVTLPIADAGVEITGIDSSEAMLSVARRKAQTHPVPGDRLSLLHGDMRVLSLDHVFGLVIIPFRGFLSLLTVEDQMKTLGTIKRLLSPGGRLAFNIFVPDADMLTQPGDVPSHFRDVTDPETGVRHVLWQQSGFDNHAQIIDTRVIVESLDGDGAVTKRLYRDSQLRYVHRWEMHHLLTTCGFEVLSLYGDFDESPFDETSTEMVWVARAPA